MTQELSARDWVGTVVLDGVDVSDRTAAVIIRDGRAVDRGTVAVRLYRLRDGHRYVGDDGQVATEVVEGRVEWHLRPRRGGVADGEWRDGVVEACSG